MKPEQQSEKFWARDCFYSFKQKHMNIKQNQNCLRDRLKILLLIFSELMLINYPPIPLSGGIEVNQFA